MSYLALLNRLYNTNIFHPVKMGLDNMIKINKLIGDPLNGIPIIHVAGTNGKGSVSLKISKYLVDSGIKTGLFVSPHISSFKERIQVNQQLLSDKDVEEILPYLFNICEKHNIPATFFEYTTALSFLKFKKDNCDAIVLEVGLGGRLDATNIITPALSVITSIQLDHTKILDDTIEKIALEKAGIMKSNVDVLVGPGCPIEVLQNEAKRVKANFYQLSDLLHKNEQLYNNNDNNNNDIDNLNYDISHAAIKLLRKQKGIFTKLKNNNNNNSLFIRPPCRFEIFTFSKNQKKIDIILDIAHNYDAIIALVKKTRSFYANSKIRIVVAMSADKELNKCLQPLLELISYNNNNIFCTEALHPRAVSKEQLRKLINDIIILNNNSTNNNSSKSNNTDNNSNNLDEDSNISQTIENAINSIIKYDNIDNNNCDNNTNNINKSNNNSDNKIGRPVVLVCGTAFIMAEARMAVGVREPRDTVGDGTQRDAQENFGGIPFSDSK